MAQKQRENGSDSATLSAVSYSRVSSKDQAIEGYSIPAQQELLRKYAESHGFTIVEDFVDVETAKQEGRPGFGQMITYLKSHSNVRTLLVEKTDRLYRNMKDWVTVDELDIDLHLVKEGGIISPDSRSSDKMMHGIRVVMAKSYVDNLSEETRKGMTEKARQGMWPSYAPLGYLNVLASNGKRTIVPDPERAPLIRRLFEEFSTGNHSLKSISKLGYVNGLRLRKSGARTPVSTIHKVLRNRVYSGDFDFDGVRYRGTYEAIVTPQLWNQVQDVLDGRHRTKTQRVKETFAFSGLITCGHCGCAMVGEIKKGRYTYYHCTGYKQKCPEPYTREEILEARFSDILKQITFTPEVLDWVKQALRESHADEKLFREQEVARLQRESKRLQDRIDAMYLDKLDGRITTEFFDSKSAGWRSEQARLDQEIQAHRNANRNYIEEGVRLLDLAQRAHALFEKQQPREKRRLLNVVLSNCSWKNGELMPDYRQPFALLANKTNVETGVIAAEAGKMPQSENWLLR